MSESELIREFCDKGIFDAFTNAKFMMTVDIELATHDDHNYSYYMNNYVRTVELHKKKNPNYKANHPLLKNLFFIFNESSQYVEVLHTISNSFVGVSVMARSHYWLVDKNFISMFANSGIDFCDLVYAL